jgi:hypothetical protein
MTAATPGQAERDHAEFIRWFTPLDSPDPFYGPDMAEAFAAGMRAARALAAEEPNAAPGEVVHLSPRDVTYVTPCCGQTPFDLTRTDRMTNDPSLVTCGRPEPKAAPELAGAPLVLTEASLGALVNAGQDYDHEDRPKGHDWRRVSDHQAARLILGAIAKLRETAADNIALREVIAAIDPAKLDLLADWFDVDDLAKDRSGRTEVQADLRRWATLVRKAREA